MDSAYGIPAVTEPRSPWPCPPGPRTCWEALRGFYLAVRRRPTEVPHNKSVFRLDTFEAVW